jgi:hypothetical protein
MSRLTVIDIEINSYNAFVFEFIGIEYGYFEGELLGLHIGPEHLIFSILFFRFTVESPFI